MPLKLYHESTTRLYNAYYKLPISGFEKATSHNVIRIIITITIIIVVIIIIYLFIYLFIYFAHQNTSTN